VRIEYYSSGGKPQYSLSVYPTPGDYQHRFLLDQERFIMDVCKLDGVYIDEFSEAWSENSILTQGKSEFGEKVWDGVTVDIDPATGEITSKYVDCSYAGLPSRLEIAKAVIRRKKFMVANTYSTSTEEQSLPTNRFAEKFSVIDLGSLAAGQKPPLLPSMSEGWFGTPIGLGVRNGGKYASTATGLMLGVMDYLRHGMLLYYYDWVFPDVPESSGEYGPVTHSFPVTIQEMHEGWIKGRERIISCVSFETDWSKPSLPRVLFFDINGRQIPDHAPASITRSANSGTWHVKTAIQDWAEFAVVE
jgi:hypothetical protein